jgi:hypothetical protein
VIYLSIATTKRPRLKRKRDDAEKAAEAGVKSAQGVLARVIEKADPTSKKTAP